MASIEAESIIRCSNVLYNIYGIFMLFIVYFFLLSYYLSIMIYYIKDA